MNIYLKNYQAVDLAMECENGFETVALHNWVVTTKQKSLYGAFYYIIYVMYIITFDDWIMSKWQQSWLQSQIQLV